MPSPGPVTIVTGGAGFIGRAVVHALRQAPQAYGRVIGTDFAAAGREIMDYPDSFIENIEDITYNGAS